jgi:hypothetical protein
MEKAAFLDFTVEVIRRSDSHAGFQVLPRRWVEERTFGWMTRWRRLVRDYEQRLDVSEAMILIAMAGILLRRNAHAVAVNVAARFVEDGAGAVQALRMAATLDEVPDDVVGQLSRDFPVLRILGRGVACHTAVHLQLEK